VHGAQTATAIGAHQPACAHGFRAGRPGQAGRYAILILFDTDQFTSKFRSVTKLAQALAQDALGQELRQHQRSLIRFSRSRGLMFYHFRIGMAAIFVVAPFRRVSAAGSDDAVKDAKIFEDFLGARLNTFAARAGERMRHFFNQAQGNAAPCQFERQRQASGAGAANQYVHHGLIFHFDLDMCNMHILIGSKNGVNKKSANTHINAQLRELHGALIEIVGVMNRPQRDEALVRAAGISLDRALFPLLVLVERLGPIGVVELADRVGRDYTTVSRQVAKLDSLGLIDRQESAADRRVRVAVVTENGKAMTDRLDRAREKMGRPVFATWEPQDIADLVRLMGKFAADIKDDVVVAPVDSDGPLPPG